MSLIHYNSLAGRRVSRIEAISDGVFAVALTLLVLDIKVPLGAHIRTEAQLIGSLCGLVPRFLAYFLSFMTLGIFWTGHAAQYNFIEKSDRNLNWITLFFLLFVSLLPFSTALLSEYIEFRFAICVYWLNIFLLGLSLYLHWAYAHHRNLLDLDKSAEDAIHKSIYGRIVIAQALYAMAALLCFVHTYVSITAIIVVQLNYAFGIFTSKYRKSTEKS